MEGRYTVEVEKENFSVSKETFQNITKLQKSIEMKKNGSKENLQQNVSQCILLIQQEQGLNNRQKTTLMNFFSKQILQIITDKNKQSILRLAKKLK